MFSGRIAPFTLSFTLCESSYTGFTLPTVLLYQRLKRKYPGCTRMRLSSRAMPPTFEPMDMALSFSMTTSGSPDCPAFDRPS